MKIDSREYVPTTTPPMRVRYVLRRVVLVGLLCLTVLAERGFAERPLPVSMIRGLQALLMAAYLAYAVHRVWVAPRAWAKLRAGWIDWAFVLVAVVAMIAAPLVHRPWHAGRAWQIAEVAVALMFGFQLLRLYVAAIRAVKRPSLALPIGFLGLIALGTLLLSVPAAVPADQPISWLDALFTATSAVCVTGLIVRDTATEFTRYGQSVILGLIQLGGLGITIFGSMLAVLIGSRMTVGETQIFQSTGARRYAISATQLVMFVLGFTLIAEALGAGLMFALWPAGGEWTERGFHSLFHSVSAFCNAGFSTRTDSIVIFRDHAGALGLFAGLIVLGGLGFPVLFDLYRAGRDAVRRRRQNAARLSLHSKIVLLTTAGLLVGGAGLIFISQVLPHFYDWMNLGQTAHAPRTPLDAAALIQHVKDSVFHSVTARTAGFNSMPMDELRPGGSLTLMGLMLIGGSPASTAGGVKTVVLGVLVLELIATLRNRPTPELFHRSMPANIVHQAAALALLFLLMVAVATAGLCLSESAGLHELLFEAISASATVGLSHGVTAELSSPGKLVIILCMFLGRTGPLVVLTALVARRAPARLYRYPTEAVVLG